MNREALARKFLRGCRNLDTLGELEFVQFSAHFGRTFRIYEGLYFHYIVGRLKEEIWLGMRASIESLCTMAGLKLWWPQRKDCLRNQHANSLCRVTNCYDSNRSEFICTKII